MTAFFAEKEINAVPKLVCAQGRGVFGRVARLGSSALELRTGCVALVEAVGVEQRLLDAVYGRR